MPFFPDLPPARPTVLVVDDSRAVLDGLCNLLQADCNALFGYNGLEAMALAASENPDLIVLDVAMQGMDGYEVLRRLKEDPGTQNIPVIFLADPHAGASEARALELGAIDFITKPYDPAILKARMHNQLAYKRSLDVARALSLGDALTGIPNRRRFDDHLYQEWNRAYRSRKPLSMILIDIDHFKRYNDTLGHPAGDACLKRVASVLEQSLQRSVDFVARYGGEEFACVLSETDLEGAESVAKRIAARLASVAIPHPDSPVASTVTLSMGVASLVPERDQAPVELTLEADQRLYEAKRLGRNRIQARPASGGSVTAAGGGADILMVLEDASQKERIQVQLADLGLGLQWAPSVAEALAVVRNAPPRVILSAGAMSEGDGFAFCRSVKQSPQLRGVPFGLLASNREGEGGLSAGFDDVLEVQGDPFLFRARVRMLLELAGTPGANYANPSGSSFLVMAPPGSIRAQLLSCLSLEGIRATFAAEFREALAAIENEAPDAMVADPSLLGREFLTNLARLRSMPGSERLPLLALCEKGQESLVGRFGSALQDRLSTPAPSWECRHRLRMLARCAYARSREEETRTRAFPRDL
ncbi:MAG TPA: diguanylate cyclase [Holophaga sp.]|nr:diguanylate cyclase [Holophaga sp.]